MKDCPLLSRASKVTAYRSKHVQQQLRRGYSLAAAGAPELRAWPAPEKASTSGLAGAGAAAAAAPAPVSGRPRNCGPMPRGSAGAGAGALAAPELRGRPWMKLPGFKGTAPAGGADAGAFAAASAKACRRCSSARAASSCRKAANAGGNAARTVRREHQDWQQKPVRE